ncbi:TetR family transcriptional regulator [Clostridium botulinum]|uniref:TetR/AcrR family transcriptional regulator n=1 Tax=Clostridium botulinum TaxID=1491 RepID=UPI0013FC98FE|nr:TetR/AcrR family transcriptional regulator [Clostridium botulinum]MBN3410438.1 TetR family transcriptional regulator [Clostridium botulinum]MBY6874282.1 TetR/AcrR family transcriptional regulator [Clostridium botulinum]MBY6888619.1 TetR/AcrR family transcriptional regulator [Clostridium botulinum]NFI46781.1 TetR/AcrR family transcriptional regulator [Clostridium botulinum]NFJ91268.1 TetR/AcrR family transcriptional regulator [Clostridium botulinum]
MVLESKMKSTSSGKFLEKKLLKEKRLYEAAYELFITKGINDTSIDDIVKKAGVAKGTFYLYFKNKYDIIDRIIIKKSLGIIKEALKYTMNEGKREFIESVLCFTDYIIEYLKDNKRLLKLIHKNLSWGIFRKALLNSSQTKEIADIRDIFKNIMIKQQIDEKEFEKRLFMIIELTGTVCYSSIILDEPYPIEEMKVSLFDVISKILEPLCEKNYKIK